MRAATAAAQEHDYRVLRHVLREMLEEMRIRQHSGISFPLDFDAAGHAADEVEFGATAHVDQPGAGLLLKYCVGLGRQQCAFVRQALFTRPLPGIFQYFVYPRHLPTSK